MQGPGMAKQLCQQWPCTFSWHLCVTFLSLHRLHGLCHGFPSHGGVHLPPDLQLLVAELLVGSGLRGEYHNGSGCLSLAFVEWSDI